MFCFKLSFLSLKSLFSLLLILILTPVIKVDAQESTSQENTNNSEITIIRPLEQDNLFSMVGGERLQTEANNAIQEQNYPLAIEKLRESRQVFNQLSNFHLQLANQFQGINNSIYDARRNSAFEAGQKRDEVTYLLAIAHEEANEAPLAIPLLIQVLESQSPTSELGKQAYQTLVSLGFSDIPFVTNENEENTSETSSMTVEENMVSEEENDIFSLKASENLMIEAQQYIEQENYDDAVTKLQEARQICKQLSSLHLRLSAVFQGINPDIYEAQRKRAFQTGQKRDEATYQMALIHRQTNQAPLAIPLLIQVINSQSPTSELGRQAYQQLYNLGFVDTPYSSSR